MMGLSADITAPDFETRVAILQRRASEMHYAMPAEVLQYVADAIRSNVRELHGALTRIGSYARIHRLPVTVTLAREQLQRVTREQDRRPTMEVILKLVCEEMGVTAKEVKGASGSPRLRRRARLLSSSAAATPTSPSPRWAASSATATIQPSSLPTRAWRRCSA